MRTNCPTAALKPERKALNGYLRICVSRPRSLCPKHVETWDRPYVIPTNDGVEELDAADEDEEGHEDVEEEGARRCGGEVLVPDMEGNVLGAGLGGEA